jgi:general secretion pathway protein A
MYRSFYGLREAPFNATPDPRFLWLNDCYQAALAALDHGLSGREGLVSLIGEAGTGKTTLLRRVLDGLEPRINAVLLLNPRVSVDEILEYVLLELGVPANGGDRDARRRLSDLLGGYARAGENVALLIDDAQLLDDEAIRELHRLASGAPAGGAPLQVVLAGQPELDAKLADPSLGAFGSRVRLRALSPTEVHAYVRTRLERAGGRDPDLFTAPALDRIAALSEGVPRVINTLCDAALLTAFAAGHRRVTEAIVEEAWREYVGVDGPARPTAAPAPPGREPMERMVRQAAELAGFGRDIDRHIRAAGISGIDGVVGLYDQLRTALGAVNRAELERVYGEVNALVDELRRYADQLGRLLAITAALEPPHATGS